MTRPSPIEVLLHPPSPRHPFTLPPVSSLLSDVTPQHCSPNQQELPSIPSLQLPDSKPYHPTLMLSIPYHPSPLSTSSSPSSSPFLSYQSLDTPLTSPGTSPHQPPSFLLPPLPENIRRSRSTSNASTSSWSSIATSLAVTAPSSPILIPEKRRLSDPSLFPSPVISTSTDPVLKRKRGRPPNKSRQTHHDHWTFVTPTVWDVKRTELLPSSTTNNSSMESNNGIMLVLWPDDPINQQNTFTSTRMDATLTMPKKKRGRKPKTQLAGNSCFVWRDLTARRGANRVKKPTPSTNHRPRTPPRIAEKPDHTTITTLIEEDSIVNWTKGLTLDDS